MTINKRFIFIMTISIISLIALSLGIYFFGRGNNVSFTKNGYIIQVTNGVSERYYFNEGTTYKQNLYDEIVFNDTENEEVKTELDSFVHYLDGSMLFLKNGVLMDLDSINESIVPYYNITNKLLIEYSSGSYFIESANKTLMFNNFIGRISDNKYIIAAQDLSVKLSENDQLIKGDYFEIVFMIDGIVNIQNQEISYQLLAEGTKLYVGNDIVIDLGEKKIYYKNEEKTSLTELTIDGNENIEITPTNKTNQDNNENKNTTNNSNGTTTIVNNVVNNTVDNRNEIITNPNGTGNGEDNRQSNTMPTISLLDAKTSTNGLNATFVVSDPSSAITGDLELVITNTSSNKVVYTNTQIFEEMTDDGIVEINLNTLAPDANYLISINEISNNNVVNQYFQKLFRTDDSGISLEKSYITSNSLAYNVIFSEESKVKGVTASLYDEENNLLGTKTIDLQEDKKEYEVLFNELNNNSSYNLVINGFILNSGNYGDKYTISKSNITLKTLPTISNLKAVLNEDSTAFKLSVNTINDPDKSISKYTYNIYDTTNLTSSNKNSILNGEPIKTFETKTTDPVTLEVDNEIIKEGKSYIFEVVAEYYDNEKISEISALSDRFAIAELPSITYESNDDETTFNKVIGTITLVDKNCTVPITGRECTEDIGLDNSFVIEYYSVNDQLHKSYLDEVNFDSENLSYNLVLDNLNSNTDYVVNLYGNVDLRDGIGLREQYYIGKIDITTKTIDKLKVNLWTTGETNRTNIINLNGQLASYDGKDKLIQELSTMKFNLYKNDISEDLLASNGDFEAPIASFTVTEDIKTNYYDQQFNILLNNFNITLDDLRSLSGGKLVKYYTIELTDAYDGNHINNIKIDNNITVIEIPAIVLLEEELEFPNLIISEIENQELIVPQINLNDDTVVGYDVRVSFDLSDIYETNNYFTKEQIIGINYYAYDLEGNLIQKNTLTLDECTDENCPTTFYLDNGTKIGNIDYLTDEVNTLKRGNDYVFKFDIDIDTNSDSESDETYPLNKTSSGVYTANKQSPTFKMYIDSSDANSITYHYNVIDIDSAMSVDETDSLYFYYDKNSLDVEEVINTAEGLMTLSNLSNKDEYTIHYKRLLRKKGTPEIVEINTYIFDGYYEYNAENLNLYYDVVYNNNDNMLRIVIKENEDNQDFIKRISLYELNLTTTGESKYNKQYTPSDLKTCTINEIEYPCISVDYADISNLISTNLLVDLSIYYDTGYTGFSSQLEGTKYSLFQTNLLPDTTPKYLNIFLRSDISQLGINLQEVPSNYYTYKEIENNKYTITSGLNRTFTANFNTVYTSNGIWYDHDASRFHSDIKTELNRKIVSKSTLIEIDSNYNFRFDSITPKINIISNPTINGSNMGITINGLTDENLSEFKEENDTHYLYLRFYTDSECTNLYREIKIDFTKLKNFNLDKFYPNPTEIINLVGGETTLASDIANFELDSDSKIIYYYKVIAKMAKPDLAVGTTVYEDTELFDASKTTNYSVTTYQLKTKSASEILKPSVKTTINSQTKPNMYSSLIINNYKDKKLSTNIHFENGSSGNFDLKYELIDNDTTKYSQIVPTETVTSTASSYTAVTTNILFDQDGNDDFIYGDYYKLKLTASTPAINSSGEEKTVDFLLYLGPIKQEDGTTLRELKDPTYLVKKTSIYNSNNTYSLKFATTVTDTDKVIKQNGAYTAKLCDPDGVNNCKVVDPMPNAMVNGTITFNNLSINKEYAYILSSNVFKNNISLLNEEKLITAPGTLINGTVTKKYKVFTGNNSGIALGSVVSTVDTNHSSTHTYDGGTNIDQIKIVMFDLAPKGEEKILSGGYCMTSISECNSLLGLSTSSLIKHNFELGEDDNLVLRIDYSQFDSTIRLKKDVIYYLTVTYFDTNGERLFDKTFEYNIENKLS